MNLEPSCALSFSAVRRALLLAGGTALLASACTTTPEYGPDGGVFSPRYGYGSPQQNSPATGNRTAAEKRTDSSRKTPDIKRDPNNTTVDVTPPTSIPDKTQQPDPDSPNSDTAAPSPETTSETPAESPPAGTKPAVPREDLPFGQPIVGKKGFVYSPFAPDKGQVEVEGIPAGTKVRCPYTGKVFRVP